MEITKQKLISLLSENYISDIDEEDKLLGRREISVEKFAYRQEIVDNGQHIGWTLRTDTRDKSTPIINIYFLCGRDIDEFTQTHKDVVDRINEKYAQAGWYFSEDACPKSRPEKSMSRVYTDPNKEIIDPLDFRGYEPTKKYKVIVNGEIVAQYDDEKDANEYAENYQSDYPDEDVSVEFGETRQLTQTTIKRTINPILNKVFDLNGEINKVLSTKSIPPIIYDNPKFLDRYVDKWTNNKIYFRSATFNTYETGNDFLTSVIKRSLGVMDKEINPIHLARQFNKNYKNWEEQRKSDTQHHGKTNDPEHVVKYQRQSSYKLDVRGYEELNMDVSLKMVFELTGEKIGNGYVWSIRMVNKFGRKRPDQSVIVGGLQPMELLKDGVLDGKVIGATKTVQLDPDTKFNHRVTVLQNEKIVKGLMDTIEEFKNKVESIQTKDIIQLANVRRADIEKVDEQKFSKIIKKTIMEMVK
jgi:hypothetical protein